MLKKTALIFLVITLALILISCGECNHMWSNECDSPKTCSLCGASEGEIVGHEFESTVTPPTCTDEGYTMSVCKRCGFSEKSDFVAAHGHTFGNWITVLPVSSEDEEGMKQSSCVNCNVKKSAPLEVVAQGNMGAGAGTPSSSIVYKLFEDGTLLLSGSGATFDCAWNGSAQPYADFRQMVKRAVVGKGITSLMGGVFAYMPNLTEYDLPSTLTKFNNNTFMDSFVSEVTEFVIPKSVNHIGICVVGQYREKNALFTKIIVENPNAKLVESNDYIPFNSYAGSCRNLTLYSYGVSNNVRSFADKYGIKYVDLESTVEGKSEGFVYELFDGTLTVSAEEGADLSVLPKSVAEKLKPFGNKVSRLIINAEIKEIPAESFKDFTALKFVSLPKTLEKIGSEAFATSSPCNVELNFALDKNISYLAPDFLKNRNGVTLDALRNAATEGFESDGAKVNLKSSIRILLIGNSLSLDAADYLNVSRPSQLYNMIKSMTGETAFVKIGVLYNGAKTAGWHATVAESGAGEYQFYVIGDDTDGKWRAYNNYSTSMGLEYDDWDIVTIQPYASETLTGKGSLSDTDTNPQKTNPTKAEKFYPLSSSLPFLLDKVAEYRPNAKVYYYLTWSNSYSTEYNHKIEDYETMRRVAIEASAYKGSVSGKGFDGLIPVGTSIQNARTTVLGRIDYTSPDGNANFTQKGLQRDGVHLSVEVGRYLAGMSFAEILVPEEYRVDGYVLPSVSTADAIGSAAELTKAAQNCVEKMLESCAASGSEKYKSVEIGN